jgi:hypothetical protein
VRLDNENERPPSGRRAPKVVAPTNRVNVALPFSKIETHEPSRELAELAAVVADLCALVERSMPDADIGELHRRAQTLANRLR